MVAGVRRSGARSRRDPGTAANSAWVYGCAGALKTASVRPELDDLAVPHHRDRSHTWAATRRSWVMNSIARSKRSRIVRAARRTCACTETSSAETGSSATSIGVERQRARDADALALAAGKFMRKAVGAARVEADQRRGARRRAPARASRASRRGAIGPSAMSVADRPARIERAVRDPGTPSGCACDAAAAPRAKAAEVDVAEPDLARVGHRPAATMQRASVDFPEPDSPTMPRVSPRRIVKVTSFAACTTFVAPRGTCARAAIGLLQAADLEQRPASSSKAAARASASRSGTAAISARV